jgi:hypothetical protein
MMEIIELRDLNFYETIYLLKHKNKWIVRLMDLGRVPYEEKFESLLSAQQVYRKEIKKRVKV